MPLVQKQVYIYLCSTANSKEHMKLIDRKIECFKSYDMLAIMSAFQSQFPLTFFCNPKANLSRSLPNRSHILTTAFLSKVLNFNSKILLTLNQPQSTLHYLHAPYTPPRKIASLCPLKEGTSNFFFFFSSLFYWHQMLEAFAPTNPRGAQALGKEFPISAPRLIQSN